MGAEQLVGTIEQVEPHRDDPTTSDQDPWRRAGDELGELGRRLRELYRTASDGSGPSEDEIKDAFGILVGAWNQVASTLGNALRDPEVRAHVRSAVGSLAEAVGATLSGLADELSQDDPAGEEEE